DVFPCGSNDAGPLSCFPGTVCCATQSADIFTTTHVEYDCLGSTQSCSASDQAVIKCHTGADCANGEYCCGAYTGTLYTSLACSRTCDHDDGGTTADHLRFCDPKNNNAECLPGETCSPSTLLIGFNRCHQ